MGLFKGIKDMKSMVHAAPGLVDQANQMSANARLMQANAQAQAHAQQNPNTGAAAPADLLEPIAGVDLATYAQISAQLAQFCYDQNQVVGLAASRGLGSANWQAALDGWNQRITASPAVAQRFNALYTGRG